MEREISREHKRLLVYRGLHFMGFFDNKYNSASPVSTVDTQNLILDHLNSMYQYLKNILFPEYMILCWIVRLCFMYCIIFCARHYTTVI
jgi:hypothetical protein